MQIHSKFKHSAAPTGFRNPFPLHFYVFFAKQLKSEIIAAKSLIKFHVISSSSSSSPSPTSSHFQFPYPFHLLRFGAIPPQISLMDGPSIDGNFLLKFSLSI
jgi:hypothetical protein